MTMPRSRSSSLAAFLVLGPALGAVGVGCAAPAEPPERETTAQTSSSLRAGAGAEGDACTITKPDGTQVPGTEKGLECCSNTDPNDCVIILKPFPRK